MQREFNLRRNDMSVEEGFEMPLHCVTTVNEPGCSWFIHSNGGVVCQRLCGVADSRFLRCSKSGLVSPPSRDPLLISCLSTKGHDGGETSPELENLKNPPIDETEKSPRRVGTNTAVWWAGTSLTATTWGAYLLVG